MFMNRCIPYKVDIGDDDESSVQVLVISSSKGNGFMFPKVGLVSNSIFMNEYVVLFN